MYGNYGGAIVLDLNARRRTGVPVERERVVEREPRAG